MATTLHELLQQFKASIAEFTGDVADVHLLDELDLINSGQGQRIAVYLGQPIVPQQQNQGTEDLAVDVPLIADVITQMLSQGTVIGDADTTQAWYINNSYMHHLDLLDSLTAYLDGRNLAIEGMFPPRLVSITPGSPPPQGSHDMVSRIQLMAEVRLARGRTPTDVGDVFTRVPRDSSGPPVNRIIADFDGEERQLYPEQA